MTQPRRLGYENFTFKQLMELDACTRCGECIIWCPTYNEKQSEAITPLGKIEQVRRFAAREYGVWARLFGPRAISNESLAVHSEGTYDCTLCARCHEVCPVSIDTRPLWIAMREQLVEAGVYPEPMAVMRERVLDMHNNLGEPNDNRSAWSANLDRQPPTLTTGEQVDLVYFVGCVSALFPMAYSIPQSLAQILERIGIPFATMGSDEWCCGFPLIIAGMGRDVVDTARHNVQAVRDSGASRLVVTCPSCYHTWRDTYPEILGEPLGFEVIHAVELLDELIDDGRLEPGRYEKRVTYHDPCDLGRTSGIYDAPRRVLRSIPGVTFHEMADHHERSLCCGGGGDVEMADPELTASVAQRRLLQAQDIAAEVIVSACQQCKRTLLGAARKSKTRIRTLDITEIMWEAMQEK
jgi:heterodisulfide reductase subunit D